MATANDVAYWLKKNPGKGLAEGYKAVGYTGPPLKVKEGNLSTNLQNLRLAVRGDNGATRRNEAMRISTPSGANTTRTNQKVSAINKKGKEADHINPISRTGEALRSMSPERALQYLGRLGQQVGHQIGNIQALSAKDNRQKDVDYRALDKHLKGLANKPYVGSAKAVMFKPVPLSQKAKAAAKTGRTTGGNALLDNIGGSTQGRRNMWDYDPSTINDNYSNLSPIPIRPI